MFQVQQNGQKEKQIVQLVLKEKLQDHVNLTRTIFMAFLHAFEFLRFSRKRYLYFLNVTIIIIEYLLISEEDNHY